MRHLRLRASLLAFLVIASQGVMATSAAEEGAAPEDISVVFVTASQPNDPFWNVVKRGAEDAGGGLGAFSAHYSHVGILVYFRGLRLSRYPGCVHQRWFGDRVPLAIIEPKILCPLAVY